MFAPEAGQGAGGFGELLLGLLALDEQQQAAGANEGGGPGEEGVEARDSPGGDGVERAAELGGGELLRAAMEGGDLIEPKGGGDRPEEGDFFLRGLHQHHAQVGPGDGQRDPGDAAPGAHVQHPRSGGEGLQVRHQRERVEAVANPGLGGVLDGGQVHLLVHREEAGQVAAEPFDLGRREGHAQRGQRRGPPFRRRERGRGGEGNLGATRGAGHGKSIRALSILAPAAARPP